MWLTLFPEDSLVKTSPQSEFKKVLRKGRGAACLEKSFDSLASWDHYTCCLKTSQISLEEMMGDGFQPFSMNWPRSGMMRSGIVCALPPLEPPIIETEYGFLPTPTKSDGHSPGLKATLRAGETWETITGVTGVVVADFFNLHGKEKSPGVFVVNPFFVEEMMGFPHGWTKLHVAEMP